MHVPFLQESTVTDISGGIFSLADNFNFTLNPSISIPVSISSLISETIIIHLMILVCVHTYALGCI